MAEYKEKDRLLIEEVRKLQNGDYNSYQKIYELSCNYIYKIINDLVKNHHATEDLMQETYIQIYKKINTLEKAEAFLKWAARIGTNYALRYLQQYKQNELLLTYDDEDEDADYISNKVINDNEEFIPESVLENEAQKRIIADILNGLSVDQKLCVQFYYFEEMSVNDIAKAMDCSTGTVKSRLNYARKALKTAISKFEVENDTKLYSLATLPVFYLVFKEMSGLSVIATGAAVAGTAGVAGGMIGENSAAVAAGAIGENSAGVAGGAIAENAVGIAGGAVAEGSAGAVVAGTATAGTITTSASVGSGFLATVAGKVAVTAAAVTIGTTTAVGSAAVERESFIRENGYELTRQEVIANPTKYIQDTNIIGLNNYISSVLAIEDPIYESEFEDLDEPIENSNTDYQYEIEQATLALGELMETGKALQEVVENTPATETGKEIFAVAEPFIQTVTLLEEFDASLNQIKQVDTEGVFFEKYYDDYMELLQKETAMANSLIDFYKRTDTRLVLANAQPSHMEGVDYLIDANAPISEAEINQWNAEMFSIVNNFNALAELSTNYLTNITTDPDLAFLFEVPQE